MPLAGVLFVFSGPAGAGKNTIMESVMESETYLHQLPTATTRPRRITEQEGREHEFLTEAEFRQRILEKALIEWQIIHDKNVYGVPRKAVQSVIQEDRFAVADVDVLGAVDLKREFGDNVNLIFVQAHDKATLEKRLRERPDVNTEEELITRLRRADFEMGFVDQYDLVIVNNDGELEASVEQAIQFIRVAIHNRPAATLNLGWKPETLHYLATGLLLQNGSLARFRGVFPHLAVPIDKLPFEAISDYLHTHLHVDVLPTRLHAEKRIIDIGFEPPQMVKVVEKATSIEKNHIYILKLAEPLMNLPDEWDFVPITQLHLDESIQRLLLEVSGDLQFE